MKRLFNIIVCACALVVSSCVNDGKVQNATDNTPSEDKGVLVLNVGTRADGTQHDYILFIYKNEEGKATLVRKYDSSNAEMQKPEYIWLLEGNYTAKVESGKAVATTFDAEELYYYGEKAFDIKGGETSTVDIVASMQNISMEVLFDQTIAEGNQGNFLEGYNVEVKADDKTKLTYTESKKGYFIMPEGCTTLAWHFEGTYRYADGEQVAVAKSGVIENVAPKKAYKLSFKYSPDANGFLGDLVITVDEKLDERDDHLSFSPDPELKGVGFDLSTPCNYAGGERQYVATALSEFVGITITADGKTFDPVNNQVAGVTYSGLNTPQLYITLSEDFFYSLNGGKQIIELCVTDSGNSNARKSLPYTLPGVNAYDKSKEVIAWADCTSALSATIFGTPSNVEILYREGNNEWTRKSASAGAANTYTTPINGLSAGRTYEYTLAIDGKMVGGSRTFTTRDGNQIPNGDLEGWCKDGDGVIIPYHTSDSPYWCTGNYGTAVLSKNITQSSSDVRPGSKGTKSMYMDSEYIVVKFAAGNGYVGSWGGMNGTNAKVYFGQPFEYNAKPKAVRFWAKWNCGSIDKVSGNVGKKGDPDLCKIFCCMATDRHLVDSSDASGTTFSPSDANIKSGDARYNKVLYSAYMESTQSQSEWKLVEIPFVFYGSDPNQVPTHLILTFTCSGYGDFFDGSTDSWLYIDDIELVY